MVLLTMCSPWISQVQTLVMGTLDMAITKGHYHEFHTPDHPLSERHPYLEH
jgi:hypothetical protein